MKSSIREQPRQGSSIRTLIVDDSGVVRASLIDFLASLPGVEVVGAAADGKEALALMVHRRPDLVVMDLNMPIMDGWQAMQRIHERHPGTRVVIVTMSCAAAVEARCLAAGADAFVCKADDWRALELAITRLFPRPCPAGQPPARPGRRRRPPQK